MVQVEEDYRKNVDEWANMAERHLKPRTTEGRKAKDMERKERFGVKLLRF